MTLKMLKKQPHINVQCFNCFYAGGSFETDTHINLQCCFVWPSCNVDWDPLLVIEWDARSVFQPLVWGYGSLTESKKVDYSLHVGGKSCSQAEELQVFWSLVWEQWSDDAEKEQTDLNLVADCSSLFLWTKSWVQVWRLLM